MIYECHIPSFPLNQFIDSFVYYKGYNPIHSVDRFLPDGNVYTVIDLTDTSKYIYDNDTLHEIQACNRVWFSGIRKKFITIPSGRDSEMFILYFSKARSYPFTAAPTDEYTDSVVDGELAMGQEILTLRDMLLHLPDVKHKFICAEQFLLKKYRNKLHINPFIDYAATQILKNPHDATIKKITDKVGYSQKHLIDIFRQHVGLSPKTFLRIMRFQKAISEIETGHFVNWTNIAIESGYYDQAHFINDFKEFSGFTPSKYMEMKGDFINYVAVR